jgi:transposase-like protein
MDCRYCGSHDVRLLNPAVSGVSGFRCEACGKMFYEASVDVSQRIHEAQTKHDRPKTDEPVNRTADDANHQTGTARHGSRNTSHSPRSKRDDREKQ